ncbi:hypothetical protein EV385_4712 [Krasilnikovia cinnamomea]|uniref:Uncharacterized protein n=1 Tax=Krasilnikovia cinnamomea TaxID=349313 RepID=A0A4Q7ZP45_9ACTN|nr:hypothetical protein [Krasilnikovia cinnamomea]RZU52828.1 hypothetical protein EV385_4712 [Krasilnikovia cinnamomea]
MFLYTDPGLRLDIYHRRAEELHRAADAQRLAAQARAEAPRRSWLRWPRHGRTLRTVRAPVAS